MMPQFQPMRPLTINMAAAPRSNRATIIFCNIPDRNRGFAKFIKSITSRKGAAQIIIQRVILNLRKIRPSGHGLTNDYTRPEKIAMPEGFIYNESDPAIRAIIMDIESPPQACRRARQLKLTGWVVA